MNQTCSFINRRIHCKYYPYLSFKLEEKIRNEWKVTLFAWKVKSGKAKILLVSSKSDRGNAYTFLSFLSKFIVNSFLTDCSLISSSHKWPVLRSEHSQYPPRLQPPSMHRSRQWSVSFGSIAQTWIYSITTKWILKKKFIANNNKELLKINCETMIFVTY